MSQIRFAFIILHYRNMKVTEECIESILKLNGGDENGIVVIDNASPNGSGKALKEKYDSAVSPEYRNIHFILNGRNDGFSRANNLACEKARDLWNPDFYIVANNDIEFDQPKFTELIAHRYEESHFGILGPDIYAVYKKVHQSPAAEKPPTKKRADVTIALNGVCLALYPLAFPLLKRWYSKNKQLGDSPLSSSYAEDVQLAGSCLVFSRDYALKKKKIFEPETFMYCEESIFTLWCKRNAVKICYDPELHVIHKEGAATEDDSDSYRRIRFQMKNILNSTKIYRKFLNDSNCIG